MTFFLKAPVYQKGLRTWIFQQQTEAKVTPATEGEQVAPGPSIPREVIEKTQDILQGIVSSSLVATALSGSGKVVGEETGHLTGQP